jgi:hypothetical protein
MHIIKPVWLTHGGEFVPKHGARFALPLPLFVLLLLLLTEGIVG